MKVHSYETFEIEEMLLSSFDFIVSSRYDVTCEVNAEKLFEFSKENDLSFFNCCAAAIYKTIEDIPEFKMYIVNGEARQYSQTNVVLPLPTANKNTRDVCIESLYDYKSFREWDDALNVLKAGIEEAEPVYGENLAECPIAVLSCLPWLPFTSFHNVIFTNNIYTQSVHWGKYEDGKMPVTITANHDFVQGHHFGLFYEILGEYLENPMSIFEEI